jgi:hypothetical protein
MNGLRNSARATVDERTPFQRSAMLLAEPRETVERAVAAARETVLDQQLVPQPHALFASERARHLQAAP